MSDGCVYHCPLRQCKHSGIADFPASSTVCILRVMHAIQEDNCDYFHILMSVGSSCLLADSHGPTQANVIKACVHDSLASCSADPKHLCFAQCVYGLYCFSHNWFSLHVHVNVYGVIALNSFQLCTRCVQLTTGSCMLIVAFPHVGSLHRSPAYAPKEAPKVLRTELQ